MRAPDRPCRRSFAQSIKLENQSWPEQHPSCSESRASRSGGNASPEGSWNCFGSGPWAGFDSSEGPLPTLAHDPNTAAVTGASSAGLKADIPAVTSQSLKQKLVGDRRLPTGARLKARAWCIRSSSISLMPRVSSGSCLMELH